MLLCFKSGGAVSVYWRGKMSPLDEFKKIERAAKLLTWGFMLNNFLGIVSLVLLPYLIWWRWNLGWPGLLALFAGIWLINSVFLPAVFALVNRPFAESARQAAATLGAMGVLEESTIRQLAATKVEWWPKVIALSMPVEEFCRRFQ